jgi:hypothetical protein
MRASPSKIGSTPCGEDFQRRNQAELTVIRLCTETPRAGERIFEVGDENLLQLAYETQSTFLATTVTPAMHLTHDELVFTDVISSCRGRIHKI